MYDVIVVGARCAGAPLAMLLARAGHKVALADRASFPSDTMSTHFLWQRGAARLNAWGLLGRLEARGCAPIRQITFDTGPVQLTGIGPAIDGVAETYCPRRTVLDALLAEAAAESGAELVDGFVVADLLWSDGRVAGVRGHASGSPAQSSLRARLVVGADGLHSTVARKAGARAYQSRPPLTAMYYSYWSGISHLGASFHIRPGRLILTWPTNDDLTCIAVAWPHDEFRQVRTDVEGSFRAALKLVPGLREVVESGRRDQRFTGTGDLPNLYRESAGPGWALAGDAGHHKDPCTGMGISDAFLAADLLAGAIDDGLTGRQLMDDALAQYQHRRDVLTANGFELTLATARLAPLPARHQALYEAAAEDPDLASQIFGVLGGSIPIADVYSDTHIPAALTQG
ncbi:MAG TPA: NAD(P)/FAD-dependent oxidoreductase [Streptosporangiaceae bacterium]|jgi:2-polyprenyl-6-methoxyphenol hydroxylase-like FAD-dependent oxidoreductase|nr:NAD(P)/FAD-dependent oxidoreductase [Streptosporangiaceae bacterium]